MFRICGQAERAAPAASGGYLRDSVAGTVECQHCRTRAYSRNLSVLALWERAHSQTCPERLRLPALVPATVS